MPSNLKKLVHARMAKTGESYQQALHQLRKSGGSGGAGGPRLETVIRQLIELADARLAENEANRKHRGTMIIGSDEAWEELRNPPPAEVALRSALKDIDLPRLRKIETISRDTDDPGEIMSIHRHLPKTDQAITASTIASKLPLGEYLRDGLELARRARLDLDAPW